MREHRLESLLLVLGCALAAWLGLTTDAAVASALPGPSASAEGVATRAPPGDVDEPPVLYPPQRIPLHFDHERHVKKTGLTCVYCHTGAATSRKSGDRLLPPAARCDACHGTSHDVLTDVRAGVGTARECSFCHEGYASGDGNRVARVALPEPYLRFDHAAHFARGIACARCHAGVESGKLATREALPKMQICLECHRAGGSAAGRATCDACHLTELGLLRTRFPTGELLPPRWMHDAEHGPDFVVRHKTVAGADSTLCASCHSERDCTDCHDGKVRPRKIHPNDWLGLHAMAARQNDPACTSCHREQSFCVSCHQRVGVSASSPYGIQGNVGRFHPPKAAWTDPPRTPSHHAWEAERNITACVGCHTERDCALCHATAARGGRGGLSPHPAGFDGACGMALARNARPCLFCHDAKDQSLTQCR